MKRDLSGEKRAGFESTSIEMTAHLRPLKVRGSDEISEEELMMNVRQ